MTSGTDHHRVAVIGAGITGLAAAWELVNGTNVSVTVFEAAPNVGGKLTPNEIVGVTVDGGAESMLAARPEAVRLATEVGMQGTVVHPASLGAGVLSRGAIRPLPTGLISGVPTDLTSLASSGIMSLPGLLRIPWDHMLTTDPLTDDVSVGAYIAERVGKEVVQRVTEPLLAGVYAGNPYDLSLNMANPSLFRALQKNGSLLRAANDVKAGAAKHAGARRGPVFAGIRGGIWQLTRQTADAIRAKGGTIHLNTPVTKVRQTPTGWDVVTNTGSQAFDAVILTAPAQQTAEMIRTTAPFAAVQIRAIDYASVALVTLAYPTSIVPTLSGSGFLIPPVEGYAAKGVTYVSQKWPWVGRETQRTERRGYVIIRASFGRYGDESSLNLSVDELVTLAANELHDIVGLPDLIADATVVRWNKALPQFRVGHHDLVERARRALVDSPGLHIAGAAYDGVGIASCIASGRQAGKTVLIESSRLAKESHG